MTETLPGIRLAFDEHGELGRVARVTIDNARRLNTLGSALMTELVAARLGRTG